MKLDLISARNRMRVVAAVSALALLGGAGSAWADVNVGGINDTTGADSVNLNDYTIDDEVELEVENEAEADNDVDLHADTGDNEIEENTTVGDFEGGDVDVAGSFVTELNAGMIQLDGLEMGDVDADFMNGTTGADSYNSNTLDVDRDVEVEVENEAEVDNDFDIRVDTGDNEFERNTTVGDISTGDYSMDLNVETTANEGSGSIDLGDLAGSSALDASFENNTTGADSTNTNTVVLYSDVEVELENEAEVDNDLDIDVDTGDNEVERNTTVGDVSTGSVSIDFSFTNKLN